MIFRNPVSYYTLQELSNLLYLSNNNAEQLLISGEIEATKNNSDWIIPAINVENYIRQKANMIPI